MRIVRNWIKITDIGLANLLKAPLIMIRILFLFNQLANILERCQDNQAQCSQSLLAVNYIKGVLSSLDCKTR